MSQGALLGNQWRSNSNRSATSGGGASTVGVRCTALVGGVKTDSTQQWLNRSKLSKRCFWNACKALSFGLLLMVIGGSMATIGYYADSLSPKPVFRSNSTVRIKSKGFHLNNLSYAGPIVMGIGGFIVVAACVMTFEARDSAAKSILQRSHKPLTHMNTGSSIHRHKVSPNRTDSSRRHTGPGNQGGSPCADVNRRALTQAFIQFSKNLHQNSTLDKSLLSPNLSMGSTGGSGGLNKSPSAPNLADLAKVLGGSGPNSPKAVYRLSPRMIAGVEKTSRNSLHPLTGGCALLNPHILQRQAVSMDVPEYQDCFSPPRSRHMSRQCSHKGSKESMDSVVHGSQASMAMDIYLPNDCPVTLKIRDRTKRSDTARRHMLVRQTPIEDDDDPRCGKCNEHFRKSSKLDVRLCTKCGGDDVLFVPRKFTPKSSFDEYISRSQRGSTNDIPMKDQLAIMSHHKHKYTRSNTIEDSKIRRKSDSFYKRKSSGVAQEKVLKQKTNLSKSPTNSVRSFQEKRLSNLNLNNQFKNSNEHLKISNSKINEFKSSYGGTPTGSRNKLNSSQEFLKTSRDSAGDAYLSTNTDDEESVSDNSRMSPNHQYYRQTRNHSYDSRQSSTNTEEFVRHTGSSSRLSSRQSSRQSYDDRLRLEQTSRQSSLKEEFRGLSNPVTPSQQGVPQTGTKTEDQTCKPGTITPTGTLKVTTERTGEQQTKPNETNKTAASTSEHTKHSNEKQAESSCSANNSNLSYSESSQSSVAIKDPMEVNSSEVVMDIGDHTRQNSNPNIDFNSVSIEMIDEDDTMMPCTSSTT
uniref:Transmembrane protein 200A n=1 Tax=Cacopsylla melanoneura TaxID=428564 RepID=A0A8D8WC49_9HEMI